MPNVPNMPNVQNMPNYPSPTNEAGDNERNRVMTREEKRRIKKSFNKLALSLFLYEFIFQIGYAVIITFGTDIFQNDYFSMTLTGSLAIIAMLLLYGWEPQKKERPTFGLFTYIWLIFLFYGLQMLSLLLTLPLEYFLHNAGFSLEEALASATGVLQGFWMITYTIVMAPLFEELLFRGFAFSILRKNGRMFAIIISSFLFALMHANIFQFIVAFLIGLLLAWVRDTYGLPYSIFLHLSNNALALLLNNYSGDSEIISHAYDVLTIGGLAVLLISLVVCVPKIRSALGEEQSLGRMMGLFFTSFFVLFLIIIFILLTSMNLG